MKISLNFLQKDKLTSNDQLIFLDYLSQCLKNGFSLNWSLQLIPTLWTSKANLLKNLALQIENGENLGTILYKIGFSRHVAVQLNMAFLEGSLIECLDQLTYLLRLKNKQLKKLKAELAYPALLVGMMVFLLVALQTFLKTEMESHDIVDDLIFGTVLSVVVFSIIGGLFIICLLKKQDYQSLKKLSRIPILGLTIELYVQYLLVYDIGILVANGFSIQQICKFAQQQENGSLQEDIGNKVANQLNNGKGLEKIIKEEKFLPNSLLMLISSGANRETISRKAILLSKTIFYELNLKLTKLVVNVQPICFLFIGVCILGMYLKILMPMYSLLQTI